MNITISYTLNDVEQARLNEWLKTRPQKPTGASGGRYTWMITHTSIGTGIRVRDVATNEEIDLTDYESW